MRQLASYQTSDRGANMRGAEAKPNKKVVIPKVATVLEQPYSPAIGVRAAV